MFIDFVLNKLVSQILTMYIPVGNTFARIYALNNVNVRCMDCEIPSQANVTIVPSDISNVLIL